MSSYLNARKQFASIGQSASDITDIEWEFPRGQLSDYSFYIHINDMNMSLSTINILHFADDSTLYIKFDKNIYVSQQVNLELASKNKLVMCK